jgi:hypothetical protein
MVEYFRAIPMIADETFELAAEVAHIDFQNVGLPGKIAAPDPIHDQFASHHLIGMPQK